MMASIYHRREILHAAARQKRVICGGRLHIPPGCAGAALLAVAALLGGCDPVRIVEGSSTHVSISYDGLANGLGDATRLAQTACGQYGKTAKLRKTYYEGLGAGERFAFFDCI